MTGMTLKQPDKRRLIGRTIKAVDYRPFLSGQAPGAMAHNPVLTLDNDALVFFIVEETESGKYGVSLSVVQRTL